MEQKAFFLNGLVVVVVEILIVLLGLGALVSTALLRLSLGSNETQAASLGIIPGLLLLVLAIIMVRGFRIIHPDQALVVFSHRKYVGTIRGGGLVWTSPFNQRQRVSLQIHRTTVTKSEGVTAPPSPLKAEITWEIIDTSKVFLGNNHYEIEIESAAKRALTDLTTNDPAEVDLNLLKGELQRRASELGIEIKSVQVEP
jgi:regulator of protease activity HflC (stomatin/prohibitin superfamily)